MPSTPPGDPARRPRRRHPRPSPGRHRANPRHPTRPHRITPRSTALWPFADADQLPETTRLAGWLGRTIRSLVTGYTRPGDRVLLLAAPARRSADSNRSAISASETYAGLTEAIWAIARLGRRAETSTATPAPDDPAETPPTSGRPAPGSELFESGSGSGPRPGRVGLRTPTKRTGQLRSSAASPHQHAFNLIITAVAPHDTDWLAQTDWSALRTPTGLLAVVTHSDWRGGRLWDGPSAVVSTVRSKWGVWLDHIAVLDRPLSAGASAGDDPTRGLGSARPGCSVTMALAEPPSLRRVHHDLLLFGHAATDTAPVRGATRRPGPPPANGGHQ